MRKNKEKIVLALDDIVCDVCQQSCKLSDTIKSARITTDGKHLDNGLSYEIDVCEKCLNKTLSALRGWRRQSGVKISAGSDPMEGQKQIQPAKFPG